MKMLVISDAHTEMHADRGAGFVADLADAGILVVAGDLGTKKTVVQILAELCTKYDHVVYVHGNHELYANHISGFRHQMASVTRKMPNFHWLNNGAVTIDGVPFVGTTFWFPYDTTNLLYQQEITDFYAIPSFVPWVYQEHAKAAAYLADRVTPESVVLTHHAPSMQSVSPEFMGSSLNRFFIAPIGEHIIQSASPALWIHGHVHASCDYTLESTRVLCNPYGYPDERNPGFCFDNCISL